MKKLTAIVLSLILLFSVSYAEVDLSTYSYDDLMALYHQIQFEIMSRPEWKEVTVPKGVYIVGEDIPEGSYTITAPDDQRGRVYIWGHAVDDYSTNGGKIYGEWLGGDDGQVIGRLDFKAGNVLELTCTVIFSPVKTLGF